MGSKSGGTKGDGILSGLKNCFAALGFTKTLPDAAAVVRRCGVLMERHKDSTEADRRARRALQENRDLCLAELERLEQEAQEEREEGEAE